MITTQQGRTLPDVGEGISQELSRLQALIGLENRTDDIKSSLKSLAFWRGELDQLIANVELGLEPTQP